jgi:hypothetical protein
MHRTRIVFSLVVACALAGVRPAKAQRPALPDLRAGDTVRVWAVAPRLNGETGIFDSFTRDTLRFNIPPLLANAPTAVSFPALRRIDRQRGVHRSPARIVIGSVLGAAAGAVVGAFLGTTIECGSNCGAEGDLEGIAGFVLGGGVGIVAGGVTGGFIAARHKSPRWQAIDLRR